MNEEDFYICGLCGSLVSKMQEEVHAFFHAETGAIQIPVEATSKGKAKHVIRKRKKAARGDSR